MPAEELPLEMRIDLEIRDVLVRYRTTAWDIMEKDILDGIMRHKWCCSRKRGSDIGESCALNDWLYIMQGRCLRPEPSEAEANSERVFMRLLRYYDVYALKVMAERADDLNKHLWYASEDAGKDIGRSAALDDWISKYTWYLGNKELMEIEYSYKRGEFREDELDLYEFVRTHRAEIEEYQKSWQRKIKSGKRITLLDATKLLFLKKQSVNPLRDISTQVGEIRREIERHQANDEETRIRIARNMAAGWRDRKVKAIEYIITTHSDRILRYLNEAPKHEYAMVS